MSFWQNLEKPLVGLSPMDGITDEPMRFITKKYGRADLIFTEFINVEHIPHKPEKLMERFIFSSLERPIVAQLSGHTPSLFYKAALVAAYLGFDGVDINMGCPVKSVVSGGGGAALIKNHTLAQEIILAVKKALDDWQKGISLEKVLTDKEWFKAVIKARERNSRISGEKIGSNPILGLSVKTRLGENSRETREWVTFLSSLPLEAITLHGRNWRQEHSGKVNWPEIGRMARIARRAGKIFLGNGGVSSRQEANKLARRYHLDGVLIGRAALGNPWVFTSHRPSRQERLAVMKEHLLYFDRLFGAQAFVAMRKHFGWYCRDFRDAKRLKQILFKTNTVNQALAIINQNQ